MRTNVTLHYEVQADEKSVTELYERDRSRISQVQFRYADKATLSARAVCDIGEIRQLEATRVEVDVPDSLKKYFEWGGEEISEAKVWGRRSFTSNSYTVRFVSGLEVEGDGPNKFIGSPQVVALAFQPLCFSFEEEAILEEGKKALDRDREIQHQKWEAKRILDDLTHWSAQFQALTKKFVQLDFSMEAPDFAEKFGALRDLHLEFCDFLNPPDES